MEKQGIVMPPRRALTLWRIRAFLLTLIPGFLCSLLFPLGSTFWIIATALWVAVFLYFFYFWYPIKWKKLRYCLTKDHLYINNGVIYTHRRFIRIENIQYVETYQSPLMGLFGLASVVIKAPGVTMYIPSLWQEDAQELYGNLSSQCLLSPRKEGDL